MAEVLLFPQDPADHAEPVVIPYGELSPEALRGRYDFSHHALLPAPAIPPFLFPLQDLHKCEKTAVD